jgi:hypothetical protein
MRSFFTLSLWDSNLTGLKTYAWGGTMISHYAHKENSMSKLLLTLSVLTAAIGLSACAYQERPAAHYPPGHYERNTTYIDEDGARIENKTSTNVYVDERGRRHTRHHSKRTKDPKGLFNKRTTSEQSDDTDEQRSERR